LFAKELDRRCHWQSMYFHEVARHASDVQVSEIPTVRHMARKRESFDAMGHAICLCHIDLGRYRNHGG